MVLQTKRKVFTADDLLRMQEDGPAYKRPRETVVDDEDEDEYTDSDDELELQQLGYKAQGHDVQDDVSESEVSDQDSNVVSEETDGDIGGEWYSRSLAREEESSSRISIIPRTSPPTAKQAPVIPSVPATTFTSFGVSAALLTALHKMSIRLPTEIQAACRDCIGNAKTGSGKTIAFALPILQKLSLDPYGIFALVLTPTRELAFQISEQFAVLGSALNLKTAVVVGGMDTIAQAIELASRPHVVVATPGRLVDLMRSNSGEWSLSRVKFLVLDEADRLLTPSFAPELSYLFEAIPKQRQTCLFTATWTPSVQAVADAPPKPGKHQPFVHKMSENIETVETLKQHYILVPSHVRECYLYYLLCNPPESTLHLRRAPPEPVKNMKRLEKVSKKSSKKPSKKPSASSPDADEITQPPPTIIFCAKPRTAAYLTNLLKTLSIRSTALHSRLTQRERLTSLGLFRASVVPVLVSTDVGARGLDIADVAMVINWDLPAEPEEYTHRVGRTARAGRGGVAVSFVTERDEEKVLKIEERIHTKLTEMDMPETKVLDHLNAVSTAKRLANMELHDSDFGKREEIHRIKSAKRKTVVGAS
ncbi:hypothetical protein EIP86_004003 [Pleurotus ostreatoroseus]|nr:hypothetical protein EIP86_004003 [Pleurotus ostreatoroseus]